MTIGGSVRLPLSFQNSGLIPAELRVDLSKHPQFTLMASVAVEDSGAGAGAAAGVDKAGAGAGAGAGGKGDAGGGTEECALIPDDATTATADDDPFSADRCVGMRVCVVLHGMLGCSRARPMLQQCGVRIPCS